jgi:dipeptidyl aminopeptidase/acylaminoacyl peptidase
MAANGYIVVAPNRRGMPGRSEWNEQISKDWGGQVMDDYLSAIDDISKDYVDNAQVVLARVMVAIRRLFGRNTQQSF